MGKFVVNSYLAMLERSEGAWKFMFAVGNKYIRFAEHECP